MLSGLALPALMELAGSAGRSAGPAVGRLMAASMLGAIAGPLAAVFLVGPALGLWWGMTLAGLGLVVAGELAWSRLHAGDRGSDLGSPSAPRSRNRRRSRSRRGPARAARARRAPDRAPRGAVQLVAVVEREGELRLQLDNHYVVGGTASTGEERLQAHIPLLLHPAPRSVAFLGVGTGITASGALFHPVTEVVAFELVPEVLDAARGSFRAANLGLLDDARVRAVVGDARSRLAASGSAFDVVVGDLVVPWRRGEASLYTLESFEIVRRALAPGGIYCQWVPLFQISEPQFDAIASSFLDVFLRAALWRGDFRAGEPAAALIGFTADVPLDPDAIEARWQSYARSPDPTNPYLADPAGLWAFLVGPLSLDIAELAAAERNRDRRPVVELESAGVLLSGERRAPAFTRGHLEHFLDAVMARPLEGTVLERLAAHHLAWRRAGAAIWEASLLELDGRSAEADARGLGGLSEASARDSRGALRPLASPLSQTELAHDLVVVRPVLQTRVLAGKAHGLADPRHRGEVRERDRAARPLARRVLSIIGKSKKADVEGRRGYRSRCACRWAVRPRGGRAHVGCGSVSRLRRRAR